MKTVEYIDKKGRKYKKTAIITKCGYCGKEFIYKGGVAHYRRSKHHYCSLECLTKANTKHGLASRKNGKQNPRYQLWLQAKRRAKKKNIPFDLKPEDIPEIPEFCPILGVKLQVNSDKTNLDSSPTLDRIDNSKGYTKDNIMIISHRANRLKGDFTLDELKRMVKFLEGLQK